MTALSHVVYRHFKTICIFLPIFSKYLYNLPVKRMFIYNYDNHTLSPCLGSFGHMMLCMQFNHVASFLSTLTF